MTARIPAVPPAWQHALPALALLLAWTLFLYSDTGLAMVTIWERSGTFTHAFLVPPITLWLVWRQRSLLAGQIPQPSSGVLLLVAAAALAWLLGELVAVNSVTQLALVTMLVLAVPAVLGWSMARLLLFPLGFLFFAVPIGEFVMPQLMEWTANFTVIALRLSGIPVYREGLQFVIPSGSWSVVEACSGVRYLIASLTVGTLFAYLNYQSARRRALFVLVSILVPVVANWMRAYLIVLLGHLSGNKLATGVDHLIYGWLFFGIVIMLMFVVGARWAEHPQALPAAASSPSAAPPSVNATRLWSITLCLAVLLAAPQLALWALARGDATGPVQLAAPNALAAAWQSAPAAARFKPAFDNPSAEINQSYASQGKTVGLYLGYYHRQDYQHKLVSSSNTLVTSKDANWAQVASGTHTANVGDQPVKVRTAQLRSAALLDQGNTMRLAVWQVYWINGTLTSNDYLAKVYNALYRLAGRGDDAAVIIVYTGQDSAGNSGAVLENFLSTNYAAIDQLLRNARPR